MFQKVLSFPRTHQQTCHEVLSTPRLIRIAVRFQFFIEYYNERVPSQLPRKKFLGIKLECMAEQLLYLQKKSLSSQSPCSPSYLSPPPLSLLVLLRRVMCIVHAYLALIPLCSMWHHHRHSPTLKLAFVKQRSNLVSWRMSTWGGCDVLAELQDVLWYSNENENARCYDWSLLVWWAYTLSTQLFPWDSELLYVLVNKSVLLSYFLLTVASKAAEHCDHQRINTSVNCWLPTKRKGLVTLRWEG